MDIYTLWHGMGRHAWGVCHWGVRSDNFCLSWAAECDTSWICRQTAQLTPAMVTEQERRHGRRRGTARWRNTRESASIAWTVPFSRVSVWQGVRPMRVVYPVWWRRRRDPWIHGKGPPIEVHIDGGWMIAAVSGIFRWAPKRRCWFRAALVATRGHSGSQIWRHGGSGQQYWTASLLVCLYRYFLF